jgi:hypothetical protein
MSIRFRHVVRFLAISLVVTAAACGGDTAPTDPGSDGILPVEVFGSVRDSLGARPVADALVTTAIARALTDANGRFSVLAPRGRTRIHVAHTQYSLKSFDAYAEPGAGLTLEIAPLGPVVLGCEVRQGVMWMLVADLQGRKTIVRRDSSGVTLGDGAARRWVVAHEFTWWALDELTWLVDGPPASPEELATAQWWLFDTDGNVRRHGCGGEAVPVRGESDGGDGGAEIGPA